MASQEKAPKICEGVDLDNDDVFVASAVAQTIDPFSRGALHRDKASGKYPVMMPCKHVYNYDTVMNKNRNNQWALPNCAGLVKHIAP